MTSPLQDDIRDYWNVQPPFKAMEGAAPLTSEWYASISRHRYEVVPYMHQWVKFPDYRGKRLLEIGCGAGTDLAEFARYGARVVGVDITETAVNLTRGRLHVEGLPGEVTTYDGVRLPFEDGGFDVVYSWGVLHHAPRFDDLFAEIARVLTPGGQFVFMLYSRASLLYHYSILLRAHQRGELASSTREQLLSRYSEFREGCPFTRAFTVEEIRERLWYFDSVQAEYEYCVYDEDENRKIPVSGPLLVETTGIVDLDLFFRDFNEKASTGENLRPFGWHLIGRAFTRAS